MNRKIVIEIQANATVRDIVSFMDALSDVPFVKGAYLKYGDFGPQKSAPRMTTWQPPTGESVDNESLDPIKAQSNTIQ